MRPIAFLIVLVVLGTTVFLLRPYPNTPMHLMDVSGHLPDLKFLLTDDKGLPISEENYREDIVLLYFGFTQCPAQCPMTMGRFSTILKKLGKDADKVHVLFVSVDPHDTAQNLHDFIHAFDPQHMSGLSGKEEDIKTLAKHYRAAYPPTRQSVIQHSNAVYIFDSHGHARLLATDNDSDKDITDDIRHLLYATN